MRDESDRYTWLLVLMAVLGIGVPGLVRSGTPASAGPPAEVAKAGESQPPPQTAQARESADVWRDFFQPLDEMFACEQPPLERPNPDLLERPNPDFGAWFERCRLASMARRREAIVALVPDPLDSMYEHTFDRLLETIDRAVGQAGYLRDRYYLPWQNDLAARRRDKRTGPLPSTHGHESMPGLLLFRRDCHPPPAGSATHEAACEPGFLAVLLVGETSTWGVHHKAFERALQVADTITTDEPNARLRILGPTFSGSILSVRSELERYPCERKMRHAGFVVVTGSATSSRNRAVMTAPWHPDSMCRSAQRVGAEPLIKYHATVTDDDETMKRFYRWLARTMDLSLKPEPASPCTLAEVGILTDTDTAYTHDVYARDIARDIAPHTGGETQAGRPERPAECCGSDPSTMLRPALVVRYPSRVAHLRTIYERARKNNAPAAQLPIEDPRRMLDLSLADDDEPVEAVPAFSDKTQFSDELVFTASLKAMCSSDLRFVGIIGNDIINQLFLAREAHRYCPNARLFTIESDVLFAHPDVHDEMNGSLIVSSYPLFPQNGAWTPPLARGTIAPFGDSTAQGVYNAMLRLLAHDADEIVEIMPPHPQEPPIDDAMPVWVSAAGNGTLWPVAALDADGPCSHPEACAGSDAGRMRESVAAKEMHRVFVTPGHWKWAFAAIWFACTIVAVGYWLGRYLPRRYLPRLSLVGLGTFRVFRPVHGAQAAHALFSWLALVPMTCAYVASAGLALIEHILQQPRSSQFFEGSLLDGLVVGCGTPMPGLPAIVTGVLLTAACADAVVAPAVAALAAKLRGRASKRWLHYGAMTSIAIFVVALLARYRGLVFERETWITLRERAINASSGLSPLVPAWTFGAAVFFAAHRQLTRIHRREVPPMADPMADCDQPAVAGMAAQCKHMRTTIDRFGGGCLYGLLLVVMAAAAWWTSGIPRAMTMLEGRVWNWSMRLAVLAALTLGLASYVPFVLGCRQLRSYLRRHASLPTVHAFTRLPGRAAQKMSAIFVKPRPIAEMECALQQLRLLSRHYPAIRLQLGDELRGDLHRALNAVSAIQGALRSELKSATDDAGADPPHSKAQQQLHEAAVTLARVLAAQWGRVASNHELIVISTNLRKLAPDHERELPVAELYQRAADDETQVWLRLAEEFVASQSTLFFHEVMHLLRQLLTTATVTALLVLAGLSSYPFERQPMLLFIMQGLVIAMVIGTIVILAGMENSEVLARIRKIEPGKVTWNRTFIARISIFGLLPILSVVATQLPFVGRALFGWLPGLLGLLQ